MVKEHNVLSIRTAEGATASHEADVPWLVAYMATVMAFGGVATDPDRVLREAEEAEHPTEEPAVAGGSGSAGPTAQIGWAWEDDSGWKAEIVGGPSDGRVIHCKVESMTAAKWAVVDKIHEYGVPFERASLDARTTAARHYLEHHVRTKYNATPEGS